MTVTTTDHEYRSYGATSGCGACLAARTEVDDSDRIVLDEVERVDYVRSPDEIARTLRNRAIAAPLDEVLASLERLNDAGMIESRDVHRIVPPGPSYVGYVRLDSMFHRPATS